MNYSFAIRKAHKEDAPAIQEIMIASFKTYMANTGLTFTLEALEETIEDIQSDIDSKDVFVAFINDVPAGSIRIQILPDHNAIISRFGVSPQFHNNGIGKAMMNLADKLLQSKNVKTVCLYTASKNKELMRFYYGHGFYVDSTTKDRGYTRALMLKDY
jgi:ribosomal protein S18 acetylase RimI-like enzyme